MVAADPSTLPLAGIKVLDLSRDIAGPFSAQILGDLGAKVIKVESPEAGDELRHWPPLYGGLGIYYMITNRNKACITLDLSSDAGQNSLAELIEECDVVIDNFRDSTAKHLRVTAEEVHARNPTAIACCVRGYRPGVNRERAAYDSAIQAYSGIMALTGEGGGDVARVGVALVDFMTAQNAAIGTLAALQRRAATGAGETVEVTLEDTALVSASFQLVSYLLTEYEYTRMGTSHPTTVPSKVFNTKSGDLLIVAGNDRQWASLAAALGHPEWAAIERFKTNPLRVQAREEVHGLIQEALLERPAEEWSEILEAAVVPQAVVRTVSEVARDSRTEEVIERIEHEALGELPLVRSPILLGGLTLPVRSAPPLLGQHNQVILAAAPGQRWEAF